ncbi:hypothetical protein [Pyxidicoccus sp. MSG2]|uniref:hypothetical protein n=1 Tax=Pyxidicoccus sp. MSG2 TaxID=2996790 RepID=UPI0022703942|nr:hypothetical protein [Pyxidicoccus sp. MSG2]MCY1022125.1 hypothetical protein [Pyxidicoccus sp. MSG2]
MSTPAWLGAAVRRSHGEAWMLGYAFARYLQLEGCSEETLAAELHCTLEGLQWLSLCRRPEGKSFTEQASAIAERFSVELLPLVQVLRRVEVLDALSARHDSAAISGMQMAARDSTGDDEIH